MRLEYQNNPGDFRGVYAAFPRRQRMLWLLEGIGYLALCGAPAAVPLILFDNLAGLLIGSGIIGAWLIYRLYIAPRRLDNDTVLLRHMIFDSRPDLLRVEIDHGWSERDWSLVQEVRETDQHLLVFVSPFHFYPVPKSVFSSAAQSDAFRKELEQHIAAAKHSTEPRFAPLAPTVRPPEGPLPANAMQVQFRNTARDYFEANQFATANRPQKSSRSGSLVAFIVLVGLSLVLLYAFRATEWFVKTLFGVLSFVTLMLAGLIAITPLLRRRDERRFDPTELQEKTLTITADGIHVVSRGSERFSRWSAIKRIAATDQTIVFYDIRPSAHSVIPVFAFDDPQLANDFARLASVLLDATAPAANLATNIEETGNPYQPPAAM